MNPPGKSWLELGLLAATPTLAMVSLIVWMVSGSATSNSTANALVELKQEFRVQMAKIDTKLEGLPSLQERLLQTEARVKEAQTFIGLLDNRTSVLERQVAVMGASRPAAPAR